MNELEVQQVLLTITGVASTLFPFLYTLIAPWWKSQVGRALVISDVSLALLVDIALLAYWFDWVVPMAVTTGILALVAVAACLRVLALVSTQIGQIGREQ